MYFHTPGYRNTQTSRTNIIKVKGEGEISVSPDIATVHLGIVTEGKSLLDIQQQNSNVGNKIMDTLLALGIKRDQIQTIDYRIESNYDYDQGKQIFRGYRITHILEVKLDDLTMVGKVIDTSVGAGANYVANVQFTTKFMDAYYQQALTLALTNANNKAATIANSLRVSLNPIPFLVIEGGETVQPFGNQQIAFAKSSSSTHIEPGQLIIRARVAAEYNYHHIGG